VVSLFQREGALELGMDRLFNAITALDSVGEQTEVARIPPPPVSTTTLPLRPPGR
jgi:hypothetical protein